MINWQTGTTMADHTAFVCKWYTENQHIPGWGYMVPWAKRWLQAHEDDGRLTTEECDDIRRLCGWPVGARQLELFALHPD